MKNEKLKIISLNIEGRRHLRQVLSFLKSQAADVICLQEVFLTDIPVLESWLDITSSHFSPLANVTFASIHQEAWGIIGNAILSRLPILERSSEYYVGSQKDLPIFFQAENPNSINRILTQIVVKLGEKKCRLATTHFTWSDKAKFSELQKQHFSSLLKALDKCQPDILCGDFNSPRGSGGVFDLLAERYQDNVPRAAKTSIYGKLHKSGQDLQLVVDGLFSTAHFQVKNVSLVGGISDHYALVGDIFK
jgi:endonuclease/exonuclease/phosphatase family metal-dependent hydrolase